jgi:hypothetical protein
MSEHLTMKDIHKIKQTQQYYYNLLEHYERQIKSIKQDIKDNENFLLKYCKHEKTINRNAINERTEYFCCKCGVDL